MDPNQRIRKAPPLPKFKTEQKKDNSQVQAKVTDFLNEIQKQTSKKQELQPIQHQKNIHANHIAKVTETSNKKFSMASLNSKLNSILTTKNINLNKLTKQMPVISSKNENTESHTISQPQYDPELPNSFQKVKNSNSKIFLKFQKIYEQGKPKDYIQIQNLKISKWIKEHEVTDEGQQIQIIQNQREQFLEQKQQIALRIMQKYGFKVGEGLGKNSQGIQAPLIAKKVTDSSCKIQQSALSLKRFIKPQQSTQNALKAFKIEKTKVIVLVIPQLRIGQLTDDIQQQIKQQCSRQYHIKQWILYSLEDTMRIFVEFQTIDQAFRVFLRINGRFYDEKRIFVYFYDQNKFKAHQLGSQLHNPIQI